MFRSVDIFDGTVITDWSKLKGQIEAVYIKATEGKTYVNPRLNEQYQNAKSQGLMVGFYHFARRNEALEEYNHFKNAIADFKQDLKPVLDYEVDGEQDYNYINQFLGQDSSLILYGSHSTLDNTHLPEYKLWVAEPETNPLNTRGYAGIQYTWKGSVDGINGDCDIDIFESNAMLENSEPVKEEKIDMGIIIVYGNDVDQRYAESLADAMNAPTINGDRTFDYSKYSTVICVGAPGELPWTSYATKIIAGNNRIETEQMVLDFIKNGCK